MSKPTLESTSDETLALAAAGDEMGAFEELLRRYQVPLLSFLRRFSPRQQDAEDLLQEAVFRLYASRKSYRARWAFRTWAFTIARRVAIDLHRRRAHQARMHEALQNESREGREDEPRHHALDPSEGIWDLARSVLTREQADALWLFHVESIPPREIAKILDRSWVSVKTMLHRARKQLKVTIETSRASTPIRVHVSGGPT